MTPSASIALHLAADRGVSDIRQDSTGSVPFIVIRLSGESRVTLHIWDDYTAYALLDAAKACAAWYEDRADREQPVA